jgi:lipopolysaccharide transport system ATP-binding protein
MTTIIRLTNIAMSFQKASDARESYQALSGVNVDIAQGERVGLVGRNGAGKSTLLRIIAGIYPPVAGSVWRHPDKTIALLSLGLGFKMELSGRDNALLAAMLQGVSRRRALGLLDEIGAFTELGEFFDEPVKTYSTGMRSRLGFATGLLLDTDVLLLDEILAVGDPIFRQKARDALNAKLSEDKTVILVHHAEQAIREMCSRAIWLADGEVREDGAVNDVLSAYATAV